MKGFILKGLVLLVLFSAGEALAQQSPYFPDTGTHAVEQNILSVLNPGVCLVIAAAPGLEDLPTIAYLRIGTGVRVAVAYITSGEDLPSDLNGETFYLLASRRKEEAYHALSNLGAESYFLNIPANEFPTAGISFNAASGFAEMFDSRLDSLISMTEPDVIILDMGGTSGEEGTAGVRYVKNRIIAAIKAGKAMHRWEVKRFFVRSELGRSVVEIPVEQQNPIWSKSYMSITREAERSYESLRYQIHLWHTSGPRRYAQVYPVLKRSVRIKVRPSGPDLHPVLSGFHLRIDELGIGQKLRGLLPVIHSATAAVEGHDKKKGLDLLRSAITSVDAFIYRHAHSLNQRDLRILTTWKLGLERLRCSILGVGIQYSVSDTLITPVQLFFLRMGVLDKAFDGGKTQLLFPGVVQKEWIVNEAQKELYDWKDGAEFRVVSPRSIPINSPETPEGFRAMQVRTPFTFIVVHHGSSPNSDFTWRGHLPLIISPYRSVEVLTPHVAMLRDSSIIVRFKSNVRDRAGGEFYVDDSLVSSPRKRIELQGKNYVVTDTLPLSWRATFLKTPRKVDIRTSNGGAIGSFTVHPCHPKVVTSKKIGILSSIENSPLETAMVRLGIIKSYIHPNELSPQVLSGYSAVVLDRFAATMLPQSPERLEGLKRWVDAGGKLIVMPQYGVNLRPLYPGNMAGFAFLPVTSGSGETVIDSTARLSEFPNRLTGLDYGMNGFPISFGRVVGFDSSKSRVVVASKSGLPLVVETPAGRGRIIYCALNLYPRFLAVDDAAYLLLANMLSD